MVYSGEKLRLAHLCLNMRIHGKVVEHGTDFENLAGPDGKGHCFLSCLSVLQRKQSYFILNRYAQSSLETSSLWIDSFVIFTLFHIKMFFYTAILQHFKFWIEYIHKSERIIHKFMWSIQPQWVPMSSNDLIKKMKLNKLNLLNHFELCCSRPRMPLDPYWIFLLTLLPRLLSPWRSLRCCAHQVLSLCHRSSPRLIFWSILPKSPFQNYPWKYQSLTKILLKAPLCLMKKLLTSWKESKAFNDLDPVNLLTFLSATFILYLRCSSLSEQWLYSPLNLSLLVSQLLYKFCSLCLKPIPHSWVHWHEFLL